MQHNLKYTTTNACTALLSSVFLMTLKPYDANLKFSNKEHQHQTKTENERADPISFSIISKATTSM